MTRIDFYILPDSELHARYLFACKLIQKTFKMGHKIVLLCDNEKTLNTMDELLWQFCEHSFLPHKTFSDDQADDLSSNILLITNNDMDRLEHHYHDLLINLSGPIHPCFSRFERVSEIVIQEPQVLLDTRANYQFYAERNYPLNRHDMRKR